MGLADKLARRRECPVCHGMLNTVLATSGLLCKHCNSYLQLVDDQLVLMPETTLAGIPFFGAAVPWKDVVSGRVTMAGGLVHPMVALTNLMTSTNDGVRVMAAQWPEGCCVCGAPAQRLQELTQAVSVPRSWGILVLGDRTVRLVASVPHCLEHEGGASLDYIPFHYQGHQMGFGIKFRWLGYRNAFCRLNPWPWSLY